MIQPSAHHPETEQEPDNLLLATILRGTEHLSDAQLLSSLLQEQDLHRAEEALRAGNLNTLIHAGPLELKALGFHEDEITRLMVVLELTARVIQQRRTIRLASLEDTVRIIRICGERDQLPSIGLIAVDSHDRILVDRILFQGMTDFCSIDLGEIFREALRVGADALVVYRFQPCPDAVPTATDRAIGDKLRIAATVLSLSILDVLVVAERSYWSARINDEWQEA
jgi:DNA repair protein RadC